MIGPYLNQTAIWRKKTSEGDYNRPVLAADKAIPCRWEGRTRLIKNPRGEMVQSTATVIVTESVETGDVLVKDGHTFTVLDFLIIPTFGGAEGYREVLA